MDPWSFGSEGKGLLFSDELDFPFDSFTRSRKASMEWESKPSYSFESAESIEFTEFGFKHFHGGEVASPTCMITPNSSSGEVDELCGSVMECNSNDSSSLIDLKLGRLVDCNIAKPISKERLVMAKRARTSMSSSSYSSKPFCQVQGCNMDLSSSKDYHKRHRVCEDHSKTSRVVVNGIEQRFCQQCSRFHLLTEFDNGKRSCRKRLAGHNERRRKPQLDSVYGKSHVFLQPVQGARFQIKFDKGSLGSPELAVPIMNEALLSKSFPFLHNNGKGHCSVIPLDTPSYDQELSESSNSSCALSLLSTQSQGFSSFSSGLVFPGGIADHVDGRFCSSVLNPIDIDHIGSIMLPKTGHVAEGKGIFLGSGFSGSKQHLPPRQGTTVDLLQLSSHLQRVQQQRSSLQIKHEDEDFFGFLST